MYFCTIKLSTSCGNAATMVAAAICPHSTCSYEMNWIADFNPKMINVVQQVGASITKRHATYRKLFDETKPFERAAMLK